VYYLQRILNLHAERLSYIAEIINILNKLSDPTLEDQWFYLNNASKLPRTEFATVAQRASSSFIFLVVRVQKLPFLIYSNPSKNCRFLCIFAIFYVFLPNNAYFYNIL